MPGHAGGGHSGSIGSGGGGHSSGGGHSGSFGSSRSSSGFEPSHDYPRYLASSSGRVYRTRSRGRVSRGIGCGLWSVFVLAIVLGPLFGALWNFGLFSKVPDKLSRSQCETLIECVEDETERLTFEDVSTIQDAIDYFYDKTGVQPYFVLLPELDSMIVPKYESVDNYLYDKYVELFPSDEGHFILLMITDGNKYSTWYIIGDDAVRLASDSECEYLLDNIDKGFMDADDIAEVVSESIRSSADNIMMSTADELKSIWNAVRNDKDSERVQTLKTSLVVTFIFGIPILFVVIIYISSAVRCIKKKNSIKQTTKTPEQNEQVTLNNTSKSNNTKYPVKCQYCGATAYPNDDGTCQYCGSIIKQ